MHGSAVQGLYSSGLLTVNVVMPAGEWSSWPIHVDDGYAEAEDDEGGPPSDGDEDSRSTASSMEVEPATEDSAPDSNYDVDGDVGAFIGVHTVSSDACGKCSRVRDPCFVQRSFCFFLNPSWSPLFLARPNTRSHPRCRILR